MTTNAKTLEELQRQARPMTQNLATKIMEAREQRARDRDAAQQLPIVERQRDMLLEALEAIIRNDPYKQSSAGIIARAAIRNSKAP